MVAGQGLQTAAQITRNPVSTEAGLVDACLQSLRQGHALDDDGEEEGIDVGCIGVLLYAGSGHLAAGLSVSARVERRRQAWVQAVALQIPAQFG